MNGTMIFFLYVLPLLIAAAGLSIVYFYGRGDKDSRPHPGE